MHVLRPLLFLLCWLPALLPRADANGTAPTASDFPMLLSTLKDGGNLYAPEFLRRVLVRQNPWSAFDPEGLQGYFERNGPLEEVESLISRSKNFLFPYQVPGTAPSKTRSVAKEVVNEAFRPVEKVIEGAKAAESMKDQTGTPGGLTVGPGGPDPKDIGKLVEALDQLEPVEEEKHTESPEGRSARKLQRDAEPAKEESKEKPVRIREKGDRMTDADSTRDQEQGIRRAQERARKERPMTKDIQPGENDEWEGAKRRPKDTNIERMKKSDDRYKHDNYENEKDEI